MSPAERRLALARQELHRAVRNLAVAQTDFDRIVLAGRVKSLRLAVEAAKQRAAAEMA